MNNAQFRDLVSNDKTKASRQDGGSSAFVPRSLGSRARSAKPMTPRSIAMSYNGHSSEHLGADQLRQHGGEPVQKKFKSSAAPKGTKLAPGYQDRTKLREDGYNEETSKEKKLKDLEKMLKEEKIDRATFDRLRDQMGIGGDLSTTHLVKGLDFKLLEKMRRGEDVNSAAPRDKAEPNVDVDVDDELDNVLEKDVTALPSLKAKSAEEQAPAQAQVLSREEILRRLKESRRAQTTGTPAPEHSLGDKFKKLPAAEKPGKKKFIETVNGRRREVLLLTNKDGSTKRKTRWIDPDGVASNENAAPLGMEVPAEFAAKQKALLEQEMAEEDDDNIFIGVADYDPLQDLDSDSEGESNESAMMNKAESRNKHVEVDSKPRNYFGDKDESGKEKSQFSSIKDDPNLIAALKRAAALRRLEEEADHPAHEAYASLPEADKEHRHKNFLERLKHQDRQDAEDMDLGFGESRFGDDDDEDGPLYDGEEHGARKSRKRGPKKRKGDKDNVADVMSVLEGRRK